jgi:caffeoyl-CoA O-methyltransferase
VRRGAALEVLPALAEELGPGSLDVAFIDADKREYPAYFELLRPLIKPGGLFLADNVLGSGSWWIDQDGSPYRAGADALNRRVAADPGFEAVAVPAREGVLIARRRPEGTGA